MLTNLIILFVASITASVTCRPLAARQNFGPGGTSSQGCDPGYGVPNVSFTFTSDPTCTFCLKGSSAPGGTDKKGQAIPCKKCDAGTFSPFDAAKMCLSCPVQHTSDRGASGCFLNCPGGDIYSDSTRSACIACPAGQFSIGRNSTTCSPCTNNSISTIGSKACTPCSNGQITSIDHTFCISDTSVKMAHKVLVSSNTQKSVKLNDALGGVGNNLASSNKVLTPLMRGNQVVKPVLTVLRQKMKAAFDQISHKSSAAKIPILKPKCVKGVFSPGC